jgi:hypothetical protein
MGTSSIAFYRLVVEAGPKLEKIYLRLEAFNEAGQTLVHSEAKLQGFDCDWSDVADWVWQSICREGIQPLTSNPSPQVDLT